MKIIYQRQKPQPLPPGCVRSDTRETYHALLVPTDIEELGDPVKLAELIPSHWVGPERLRWGVRLFGPLTAFQGLKYRPESRAHSLDYFDTLREAKSFIENVMLRLLAGGKS